MDDSGEEASYKLCIEVLAEAGINPKIYPIENERLSRINIKVLTKIHQVREIAKDLNFAIGIVGGFVRDLMLNEPSDDVDFVIFHGDIDQLTNEIVKKLGGKVGKMSNRTLTTQVRFPDKIVFEFNSTRKERYEYPSRVPIVEKASIAEDLNRRDFTINALMMFEGFVLDIFDGMKHLETGVIKTTREPDIVFHEDYLRMFRAIRFACRLGFEISEQTKNGIRAHVRNILDVPSERILHELKLSFTYDPLKAFMLMVDLKIFETMFPEIENSKLNQQIYLVNSTFKKIEAEIKFLMENEIKEIYPYLALILQEITLSSEVQGTESRLYESQLITEVQKILNKYKFSNKEKLSIQKYIVFPTHIPKLEDDTDSSLRIRQFIRDTYPKTRIMILLHKAIQNIRKSKLELSSLEKRIIELGKNKDLIFFEPALNGNEIAESFNLSGHDIGRAKQLLVSAIMNEEIQNTKRDCFQFLEEKFSC